MVMSTPGILNETTPLTSTNTWSRPILGNCVDQVPQETLPLLQQLTKESKGHQPLLQRLGPLFPSLPNLITSLSNSEADESRNHAPSVSSPPNLHSPQPVLSPKRTMPSSSTSPPLTQSNVSLLTRLNGVLPYSKTKTIRHQHQRPLQRTLLNRLRTPLEMKQVRPIGVLSQEKEGNTNKGTYSVQKKKRTPILLTRMKRPMQH